jgi:hypothetical protein
MSNKVNYIITDHNITVNYQGQTHIVPRTDKLADQLIQAIRDKRTDLIPNFVSNAKRVENFGKGNFTVKDDKIFIKGQQAPEVLSRKIIDFTNQGLPHEPLLKFAENLLKNPSFRAVNELFQFLEKNNHPITDNGCFIAYKKVRSDFKDGWTGTIDNSPGLTVEVPRNAVDEDATRTCSNGLHVANWDYANNKYSAGAGALMLEVEVNPADVVAVPVDYDSAKMRVCRYVVLGVVDKEHSEDVVLRPTTSTGYPSCDGHDRDEGACDSCGEVDCYDRECEGEECDECGSIYCIDEECLDADRCSSCGEVDCYDMECEDEEEDDCPSCGGLHQNCDIQDRYPWEDELED